MYRLNILQWNNTFFDFSVIIVGTREKVLKFTMPLRSIYNQNIGFIEQILHFGALQRGLNNEESINWHYIWWPIQSFPYMFMLVLHKDALFHCKWRP